MSTVHIISFTIPFPPDYGGVIDVYYKLKALNALGVEIILHCFEYSRKSSEELNKICRQVFYYPRRMAFWDLASPKPFIAKTRAPDLLLQRLLADDAPILFEGLHTCMFLNDARLKRRRKLVRLHNIEWDYYRQLSRHETNLWRRFYFFSESVKLRGFEKILQHADVVLSISLQDHEYVQQRFHNSVYLPPFHPNESVESLPGKGTYLLYHGNLSVAENNQAAIFLVTKVAQATLPPLVIAGHRPSEALKRAVAVRPFVTLHANPSQAQLHHLVQHAHVHLLPAFQNTGTKLKLLYALFNGRFVVTNTTMVSHTPLNELCQVADDAHGISQLVQQLMEQTFTERDRQHRAHILMEHYSNRHHAMQLLPLLFP